MEAVTGKFAKEARRTSIEQEPETSARIVQPVMTQEYGTWRTPLFSGELVREVTPSPIVIERSSSVLAPPELGYQLTEFPELHCPRRLLETVQLYDVRFAAGTTCGVAVPGSVHKSWHS